jgi:Flp pilus assembly protein TadG
MAMVEMVIIAPLLLMLIFAIAEFGVMFGRWQNLSNAAREGARTAVVFRTACNSTTVETEVRTRVKTYAACHGRLRGREHQRRRECDARSYVQRASQPGNQFEFGDQPRRLFHHEK